MFFLSNFCGIPSRWQICQGTTDILSWHKAGYEWVDSLVPKTQSCKSKYDYYITIVRTRVPPPSTDYYLYFVDIPYIFQKIAVAIPLGFSFVKTSLNEKPFADVPKETWKWPPEISHPANFRVCLPSSSSPSAHQSLSKHMVKVVDKVSWMFLFNVEVQPVQVLRYYKFRMASVWNNIITVL